LQKNIQLENHWGSQIFFGFGTCLFQYVISFKDARYLDYKPSNLPMDPQFKLNIKDGDPLLDPSLYRRLIGTLLYLTISRPVICVTVNRLSQFISNPRRPHLAAIHPQWRYLKATASQGLIFFPESLLFA